MMQSFSSCFMLCVAKLCMMSTERIHYVCYREPLSFGSFYMYVYILHNDVLSHMYKLRADDFMELPMTCHPPSNVDVVYSVSML